MRSHAELSVGRRTNAGMQVVVVPEADGRRVRVLAGAGVPGAPEKVDDLAGWMAARGGARAALGAALGRGAVPGPARAGVRLDRCHDLALTEGILLAFAERPGRPRNLAAAWARLHDLPEPDDPPPASRTEQPALFEADREPLPAGADPLDAAVAVYADQQRRIAATRRSRTGYACWSRPSRRVRWRPPRCATTGCRGGRTCTCRCSTVLLGPRPSPGARPRVLAELAEEITAAFGLVGAPESRQVNPDNPASVVRAFARAGIDVPSSRAHVLRRSTHPAVAPLLRYKELAAAVGRATAGRGWTRGCTAAGSGPSTWSAAWCPAAGRPAAGRPCSCRERCARRCARTRAGSWWSPTPRSSSRGCWRRCPATGSSRRSPRRTDLYTDAGRGRVRRQPRAREDRRCCRPCTAARRAAPGRCSPSCASASRTPWTTWSRRRGRARRAAWCARDWAGRARRRASRGAR